MEATIFYKNGKVRRISHVQDITWSKRIVYLDILQSWNECGACDVECIGLKDIDQIKLKESEG